MNALLQSIQRFHTKLFTKLSEKAKTSKLWAILLSLAVLYEIIEHIVWPILVPYLMYMQWFK